jgi:hypothetical protein
VDAIETPHEPTIRMTLRQEISKHSAVNHEVSQWGKAPGQSLESNSAPRSSGAQSAFTDHETENAFALGQKQSRFLLNVDP